MKFDFNDVVILAGLASVVYGCALVSLPLAFILAGAGLIGIGIARSYLAAGRGGRKG
jgi:hypothetical protein